MTKLPNNLPVKKKWALTITKVKERSADVDDRGTQFSHRITKYVHPKMLIYSFITLLNFCTNLYLDENLVKRTKWNYKTTKGNKWSSQVSLGSRHKAEEVMEKLLQKHKKRSLMSAVTAWGHLFYYPVYKCRCVDISQNYLDIWQFCKKEC